MQGQRALSRSSSTWLYPLGIVLVVVLGVQCVGAQVTCACPSAQSSAYSNGCSARQVPVAITTSGLSAVAQLGCVNAPQFSTFSGTLYVPFCFNTTCYPAVFATGSIVANVTLSATALPVGRYALTVALPTQSGANGIALSITVPSSPLAGNPGTITAGGPISVPTGGLPGGISLVFTLSQGYTLSNIATATFTTLDAVLQPPPPPLSVPPPPQGGVDPCGDLAQRDPDSGQLTCPDGTFMLNMYDNAGDFNEINYPRYTGLTFMSNGTRCITPPTFDPYTMIMTWQFNWTMSCYNVSTYPIVMLLQPALPGQTSALPNYARMTAVLQTTLSADANAARFTGTSDVQIFYMLGPNNATAIANQTGNFGSTGGIFDLPEPGLSNLTFAFLIKGGSPASGAGTIQWRVNADVIDRTQPQTDSKLTSAYFLPQGPDISYFINEMMLVNWGADVLLPTSTGLPDLNTVVQALGWPGLANLRGRRYTQRLLLRDNSFMFDCSNSSLRNLRNLLAAVSGVQAALFHVTCSNLAPGAALTLAPLGAVVYPPPPRRPSPPPSPSPPPTPYPPPSGVGRRALAQNEEGDARPTGPPEGHPRHQWSAGWLLGTLWRSSGLRARGRALQALLLPNNLASCADAQFVVDVSLDAALPSAATAPLNYLQSKYPSDVQLSHQAPVANPDYDSAKLYSSTQTSLDNAISNALITTDPSLWCTSASVSSLVVNVQGGFTYPTREPDLATKLCAQGVAAALPLLGVGAQYLGPGTPALCSTFYVCRDCWPYPIPQWALVLCVMALVVVVVVVLALRVRVVRSMSAKEVVLAGQLDDTAILLELQKKQVQELEMQERLRQQPNTIDEEEEEEM